MSRRASYKTGRGELQIGLCLTNWTFGPWAARIGRRRMAGLDLGPLSLVWRGKR